MTIKERLIQYIKYKNLSQAKFEKETGLSNGYVNNIRVSIQPKTLTKITGKYPDLNTAWLLTGEGEMLKQENKTEKLLNEFSDKVLSFLKSKTDNATDTDLKSMNVGDLLFLQMLEKINKLEKKIEKLESEIDTIKKRQ